MSEITASSAKSFEDAIQKGISRATKTLDKVQGAWIQDQEVVVEGGKITEVEKPKKPTPVVDLMAALKQSLAEMEGKKKPVAAARETTAAKAAAGRKSRSKA